MTPSPNTAVKPMLLIADMLTDRYEDLLADVTAVPNANILGMTVRFYWDGHCFTSTGSARFLAELPSGPTDVGLRDIRASDQDFRTLAYAATDFVDGACLDDLLQDFVEEIGLKVEHPVRVNGTLLPKVLALNVVSGTEYLVRTPLILMTRNPSSNHDIPQCFSRLQRAVETHRRAWSFQLNDLERDYGIRLADLDPQDLLDAMRRNA
jgi:hypothetical protein